MTWRKDTLADKEGHRHSDSLWLLDDELADLRESMAPQKEPVPFDWLGLALGVLCFGLLAVSLAVGIGEVWQWNK